jgi:hypothetical protein
MKKYFAKFLPIEGEIKEGDTFIENEPDGTQSIMFYDPKYDHSRHKPYKLFLCSRDIQVGDEMTSTLGPIKGKVEHELQREEAIKGNHWYKLVGEISPEATWVVENQEFEENETQKVYQILDGLWTNISEEHYETYKGKQLKRNFVKIKCPICKTFH